MVHGQVRFLPDPLSIPHGRTSQGGPSLTYGRDGGTRGHREAPHWRSRASPTLTLFKIQEVSHG